MSKRKPIRLRKRLLRGGVILIVALLGVTLGVSWLANRDTIKSALTRRLAAAIGRPVEVDSFRASLLGGPQLEAFGVTVAEDPRFGHEHFLRAERMTGRVRWQSLLRGRLEFASLSLTRPSLNLVRNPDGRWNLEHWTPPPPPESPNLPAESRQTLRARIAVDAGRINFKRGPDKHPFALVGVSGRLEQAGDVWRMDLEATPMRAGVMVQEPGVIRATGELGSFSGTPKPSDLRLTWEEVALSDALRLLAGRDFGVRGSLAAQIHAQTTGARAVPSGEDRWQVVAELRLTEVHRWDLPLRPGDPALNLRLDTQWTPERSLLEGTGLVEAPASTIRVSGKVAWAGNGAAGARGPQNSPTSAIRLISSAVSLNDLLAWHRAFRPGVPTEIAVEGHTGLEAEIQGWPPHLERVVMATDGARLRHQDGTELANMGRATMRFARRSPGSGRRLELLPATISFGARSQPGASLRLSGIAYPDAGWRIELDLSGQASRVQEVFTAATALNLDPLGRWVGDGWSVQGSATVRMQWQGRLLPWSVHPAGYFELRSAMLRAPFLNLPVSVSSVRADFGVQQRRLTWSAVQMFGTSWRGAALAATGKPWGFTLVTDRVDAADFDRWLNPVWAPGSPGILQRIFSARRESSSIADLLPGLQARGEVTVGELVVAPLTLRRLVGRLQVGVSSTWNVELAGARAEFSGGGLRGSFHASNAPSAPSSAASAGSQPAYRALVQFERIGLTALGAPLTGWGVRVEGVAEGDIELHAQGLGRQALLDSLSAKGATRIRGLRIAADLADNLLPAGTRRQSVSFRLASGNFRLAGRRIEIDQTRLTPNDNRDQDLRVAGHVLLPVNQPPAVDLQVEAAAARARPAAAPRRFHITGALMELRMDTQAQPPRP